MKKIKLEEQKKIELEILDDVTNFCERHGLRYFLAYGTLLGAIRHKGYIPWDDDIDIHMPRPDYEKFLKLYNKEQKSNKAIAPELNSEYRVPFAKVYREGTIIKEFHFKPNAFGVYIDIFPLDGYAGEKQAHRCSELRRYMHVKNSIFLPEMKVSRILRLAITKLILLPFGIHKMIAKISSVAQQKSYNDSEQVFSSYSRFAVKEIFPRSIFESYRHISFEGKEYRAPLDCDLYLRTLYGNYMILPPEEKRHSTHNSQAWYIQQ